MHNYLYSIKKKKEKETKNVILFSYFSIIIAHWTSNWPWYEVCLLLII